MDQESNFQDSAKSARKMEVDPDLLSELPDSLQLRIISRLPLEDAVRSGALSTRWKDLWKHVDEITIKYPFVKFRKIDDLEYDECVRKNVEATDRILMQLCCPNIKKLELGSKKENLPTEVVDKWLRWAYSRHVKILNLDVGEEGYCAPEWFCHNSTLEKMSIDSLRCGDQFELSAGSVSWTSLKSLSLENVDISDEDISKILSGCPVLEVLELEDVKSITQLNIVSPSVKTLRVFDSDLLEVNAPCLEVLDFSGLFSNDVLRLNVSSLLKANLNLLYEMEFDVHEVDLIPSLVSALLEGVFEVEELALGLHHIAALSLLKMLGKPCPLFQCKHLTVCIYALKHELPGIAYLLQKSPNIETLVIKVEYNQLAVYWEEQVRNYIERILHVDGAVYLSRQKMDFQNLKIVKISYVSAMWNIDKERFDFELASFIKRNSCRLEQWIVTSPPSWNTSYFSHLCRRVLHCFPKWVEAGEWKVTVEQSSCKIMCKRCVGVSAS